jgi:hypothetical protein
MKGGLKGLGGEIELSLQTILQLHWPKMKDPWDGVLNIFLELRSSFKYS